MTSPLGPSTSYVRKIFQKSNISYTLVFTYKCTFQKVRNVSFSDNFRTYYLDDRHSDISTSPFFSYCIYILILVLLMVPRISIRMFVSCRDVSRPFVRPVYRFECPNYGTQKVLFKFCFFSCISTKNTVK